MLANVYLDGACEGNGTDNTNSYCSFKVVVGEEVKRHRRVNNLKASTNNEAEYAALLHAFEYIGEVEDKTDAKIEWLLHMDSNLVYQQVVGSWKCKAANLTNLCAAAKAWVAAHSNVGLVRVDGEMIKAQLGH